ncbi:MAG: hypothetical protein ACOC44_00615 [Promethearchaeia archaeon]
MIETYTFAPYLMLYFAAIIQTFIMVSFIVAPQNYEAKNEVVKIVHGFFMHFGFTFMFLFGAVFLDTALAWLFGQWVYADWRFQLPAVIFLLLLGIQYVVGSLFINPRISTFIYSICAIVAILLGIHVYIPSINLRTSVVDFLGLLILLQIIYLVMWGINTYLDSKERFSWKQKNRALWDISEQFQSIFSRRLNIIIWIIVMVEVWLKLFGSSIFIWF